MTKTLTIGLILALFLPSLQAQDNPVVRPPELGSELAARYCSAFTSIGESILVRAVGSDIQLDITPLDKKTLTVHIFLNSADITGPTAEGPRSCAIFISASNNVAAIGVRDSVSRSEKKPGTVVVMVDLKTNQSAHQYFVESREVSSVHDAGLVGFLGDSEDLVVLTEQSLEYSANVKFSIITASNGEAITVTRDLSQISPLRDLFFDTRNNLIWVELEPSSDNHRKLKMPLLQSISLTGIEKPGPSVDLRSIRPAHNAAKWYSPPAVAFPTSTTVVFAETRWDMGFEPNHLWYVDLAARSIKVLAIPKDLGATILHGMGFAWFENVGNPAALSPDGRFVVIPIRLTTIGPPYIADNYIDKGEKLVIVDLQQMRILCSINPNHNDEPVGFALDHRDGKVTLVVNWQEGWKRLQFGDSR